MLPSHLFNAREVTVLMHGGGSTEGLHRAILTLRPDYTAIVTNSDAAAEDVEGSMDAYPDVTCFNITGVPVEVGAQKVVDSAISGGATCVTMLSPHFVVMKPDVPAWLATNGLVAGQVRGPGFRHFTPSAGRSVIKLGDCIVSPDGLPAGSTIGLLGYLNQWTYTAGASESGQSSTVSRSMSSTGSETSRSNSYSSGSPASCRS